MRFGSRGPSKFCSNTSPKCIDREGLEKRRLGNICLGGCFSHCELVSGLEVVLQESGSNKVIVVVVVVVFPVAAEATFRLCHVNSSMSRFLLERSPPAVWLMGSCMKAGLKKPYLHSLSTDST